jgi:hypothetical protein
MTASSSAATTFDSFHHPDPERLDSIHESFVDTWNEQPQRSTIMSDDFHLIIADLLDFNDDNIN